MQHMTSNKPSCRFCGSTKLHKTTEAPSLNSAYNVLLCRHCNIGMTWPQPDVAALERYYAPGEYRGDEGKRFIAPVEWLFELHKKQSYIGLTHGLRVGNMLDIGCGSGYTASLFAAGGWEVTGVEFNNDSAGHARETYGIKVVTSIFNLHGPFDLILVNHVLEHWYEPEKLLLECKRLLSPAGRLVVAVPDFGSFQSRFGRDSWFHCDLPVHLFHFTQNGLEVLLAKSGYVITGRSHADFAQNFYGWLQTLLNRSGLRHNALYNFIRMRNRGVAGVSPSVIISLFLCLLVVPLSLLGMLVEKVSLTGGTIRFTAVHNQAGPLRED